MRKSDGSLHFYVNGTDQGLAASGIPSQVYAVIDLYGKCAQVSICKPTLIPDRENGNYTFFDLPFLLQISVYGVVS